MCNTIHYLQNSENAEPSVSTDNLPGTSQAPAQTVASTLSASLPQQQQNPTFRIRSRTAAINEHLASQSENFEVSDTRYLYHSY